MLKTIDRFKRDRENAISDVSRKMDRLEHLIENVPNLIERIEGQSQTSIKHLTEELESIRRNVPSVEIQHENVRTTATTNLGAEAKALHAEVESDDDDVLKSRESDKRGSGDRPQDTSLSKEST